MKPAQAQLQVPVFVLAGAKYLDMQWEYALFPPGYSMNNIQGS
jgi:hypothetical protein